MTEQSMKGQVAVVTGGAGGIGTAICTRLAEAGARVVLTGRTAAKLDAAAALPGNGHWGYVADVTDSASLAALAAEVEAREGRLDVLVNNAGFTKRVPMDDLDGLTDDVIDEVFRVNWRGTFACVRAFRPLLQARGGGTIVNISSAAGIHGQGSSLAYVCAKAAVNMLTVSLARALAPKIRVVAVAPGFVNTGFATSDPAVVSAAIDRSLLKTDVPPEGIADAVLAVATKFQYTTGAVFTVDGGRP